MTDDREALLRAVASAPDDDLPRLVYADWFDENGDPDRAVFIRAQVEFARHYREAQGLNDLARQQFRDTWAEHHERWRAELPVIPGVLWDVVFHRGFIERASVASARTVVTHFDDLFGRSPLLHLIVRDFSRAAGFAELEPLRHLKTCHLTIPATADERDAEELLGCTAFRDDLVLFLHVHSGDVGRRQQEIREKFGRQLFLPAFTAPATTTTRRRRR
jgi:uncharacterized protein (TIGR02996 family)